MSQVEVIVDMALRPDQAPRISLNKLCEFMTASIPRQRRIVRDQKFPPDYLRTYYREAQEAVASCIASELDNVSAVERQIDILNQQAPDTVGTQRRIASNVDALETFLDMLDQINLQGAVPELGANDAPKLRVRNVDISVRPEIILRMENRNGPVVGAMKVHFPKTNPLDERSAGYASAILQEWTRVYLPDDGSASGPLCCVLDIGSQCFYEGVRATRQRMRDIEDACATIAALWPTIQQSG
ncbi:hypothetical protein A33O_15945 [Nitratireductor aquibiodomus RA22]|uniref:Uncharacterized protein n=1 Tax=Nitratireductor aquibiodomus RA22 TaxID=1189611 RepID=I5BUM4_9HYPH|nr:hypothetical protein [Nitratireductor aquibiodomus]EIM73276.1 hypothetical protein A33O_15945 [Nitratireductor aquibiodomus RA22]